MEPARRRCLLCLASLALGGCAGAVAPPGWTARLRGDTVALLGEVHDNEALHRLRLAALRRAVEDGWRPAVAMEQFGADRQQDIERARRGGDAQRVVEAAGGRGWDWPLYRPLIALALAHDLPLVAADLPAGEARRIAREPPGAGAERVDAAWRAAQEREIEAAHCHALPAALVSGLARAQFARDAHLAAAIARHADGAGGVVLIAGNGHVRRDLGVPRWLDRPGDAARVLAVGFVEDAPPPGAFDAVVVGPAQTREDPCRALRRAPAEAGDAPQSAASTPARKP